MSSLRSPARPLRNDAALRLWGRPYFTLMNLSITLGSALCNSVLCFCGCLLVGMRGTDLALMTVVAGVATFAAMVTLQVLAAWQMAKSESR